MPLNNLLFGDAHIWDDPGLIRVRHPLALVVGFGPDTPPPPTAPGGCRLAQADPPPSPPPARLPCPGASG